MPRSGKSAPPGSDDGSPRCIVPACWSTSSGADAGVAADTPRTSPRCCRRPSSPTCRTRVRHPSVETKPSTPGVPEQHLRSHTSVSSHGNRPGPHDGCCGPPHCAENAPRSVARAPWSTPSQWHASTLRGCRTPRTAHPSSPALSARSERSPSCFCFPDPPPPPPAYDDDPRYRCRPRAAPPASGPHRHRAPSRTGHPASGKGA